MAEVNTIKLSVCLWKGRSICLQINIRGNSSLILKLKSIFVSSQNNRLCEVGAQIFLCLKRFLYPQTLA